MQDKIIQALFRNANTKKVNVTPVTDDTDVTQGARNITKMLIPKISPITKNLYLGHNQKRVRPNLDKLKQMTMPNFKRIGGK